MAILEALGALLRAGFTPERTVVLAFGHDEEVGGLRHRRAHRQGPRRACMDWLAPELPLVQRMVLSNRWLFAPLVSMTHRSS